MAAKVNVLPYCVGGRYLGIELERVHKVVRSALVTPMPDSPATVAGILNLQGHVVPVVDMRQKLGLEQRPMALGDVFIVVRGERGMIALWVDEVYGASELGTTELATSGEYLGDLDFVRAVVRFRDELLVVHDLEDFLGLEQAAIRLAGLPQPEED